MGRDGLSPTVDAAMPNSTGRIAVRPRPPAMLCEP